MMEQDSNELKDEMYDWLFREICEAQAAGVPVTVDGKYYSVQNVSELKGVMENHYYMKSYMGDEFGKVVRIDFDRIISV